VAPAQTAAPDAPSASRRVPRTTGARGDEAVNADANAVTRVSPSVGGHR
jgi:hypothetical protein